ncbi:proteinase-activated receptor 1-like isoform X2 [Embiotoca jacksoni]|uniref:proteinase-activated receptor 1-like isoform X2 n=1 Tax=Embiotoca jacksoni TaxID=100190 RepID=UPI0037045B0F
MSSFIGCRMFSASLKSVVVVVVVVCVAASDAANNGTVRVRTFLLFDHSVTDEPLNLDLLYPDEDGVKFNRSSGGRNVSGLRPRLSDEALVFLTGPVSTVLIPSFYTLVCVLSVPINVCALLAFARGIWPKKPAAIYMLNLASADLLFALVLPFKIFYHFDGNHWRFGAFMCRAVTAAFYWNMYCSVLLIACISVDRLLAVVYPIDSLTWRRPKNAVVACASMWVVSFAGSVPLVLSEQTVHLAELNITTCHDVQSSGSVAWLRTYFLTLVCALFFLPLVVTVASYARVVWSLSGVSRGVPGSSRRRSRAVVMALTVLVIFLLCFIPTNCLLLAHYLQLNEDVETSRDTPDGSYALYLLFLCLGSLNCLLDPLVYYFGSSQCQRQLSNALRCQKVSESSRISHSSSDSCRSSTRTMLKSSRTETSRTNSSVNNVDSFQASLSSQYKKLLV